MVFDPQVFVMVFGAFLALIGTVLFALFLWFKNAPPGVHEVSFLRFGIKTSQPALIIFFVGCALIVTPLLAGDPLTGQPPTETHAQGQTGSPSGNQGDQPVQPASNNDVPQPTPTPTPPSAPTATPTEAAAGVSAHTLAGEWDLIGESCSAVPTGRFATLYIEAVSATAASFAMFASDSYYFGEFEISGRNLVGYQSNGVLTEPIELQFSYVRDGRSESLTITGTNPFCGQVRQEFQRLVP